jgi:hypothetical protein
MPARQTINTVFVHVCFSLMEYITSDVAEDPTTGVFSKAVAMPHEAGVIFPRGEENGTLATQYTDAYLIVAASTEADAQSLMAKWEEAYIFQHSRGSILAAIITEISDVYYEDETKSYCIRAGLDFTRVFGDPGVWVWPGKAPYINFKSLLVYEEDFEYFQAAHPQAKIVFCRRNSVLYYTAGPSTMPCSAFARCRTSVVIQPKTVIPFYNVNHTYLKVRSVFVKIANTDSDSVCYPDSMEELDRGIRYIPTRVLKGGMVEMVPECPPGI